MKVPTARVFLKYNTKQLEPALTLNYKRNISNKNTISQLLSAAIAPIRERMYLKNRIDDAPRVLYLGLALFIYIYIHIQI